MEISLVQCLVSKTHIPQFWWRRYHLQLKRNEDLIMLLLIWWMVSNFYQNSVARQTLPQTTTSFEITSITPQIHYIIGTCSLNLYKYPQSPRMKWKVKFVWKCIQKTLQTSIDNSMHIIYDREHIHSNGARISNQLPLYLITFSSILPFLHVLPSKLQYVRIML